MRTCIDPHGPLVPLRVVLVSALTLLLSGWDTCSVMGAFNSCESSTAQPQVTSLSPGTIFVETESVSLTVNGSNFTPQSQIMWNGNGLPTTFVDSHRLETTITQQTIASFGTTAGSTVQISVMSSTSVVVAGCANGGSSVALLLVID